MIVGLSGYARSGKDSVADVLVNEFGFIRTAFADKLRECLYALNPIVNDGLGNCATLQWVIDTYGWDGYKATEWGTHIREYLQRFGTEVGRNILGKNIWVDATFASLDKTNNYVFTDCRFLNEANGIQNLGGAVWRINRPEVGPVNDHVSEIGLDDFSFDTIIYNNLDLTDLAETVRLCHRWYTTTKGRGEYNEKHS